MATRQERIDEFKELKNEMDAKMDVVVDALRVYNNHLQAMMVASITLHEGAQPK